MKRIKITYFTLLLSVFIASILFTFEANSQTAFTFDTTDFIQIINRTMPPYSSGPVGGSFWYGPMTDNGRSFDGYIFTDTFQYQSVILHHNTLLDLRKDFVFQFKVNFGNRVGSLGGDGFAFILHQSSISNDLIGQNGGYIGYGHTYEEYSYNPPLLFVADTTGKPGDSLQAVTYTNIIPSFCIELDPCRSMMDYYVYPEGIVAKEHISYLFDGNVTSDSNNTEAMYPNTFSIIRDGWWHCFRIEWANNTMRTYIDDTLRMSRYYANISDLVSSASETNPMVRFAISASTGAAVNLQKIEFVSMQNSDGLFPSDTAHIAIADSDYPIELYALGGDTIETACGFITIPSSSDTIYYPRPICPGHPINITLSDTTGAKWFVLKNGSYTSIPSGIILLTDSILSTYDTIKVRLILHGDTTYFVFNHIVSPDSTLINYFADSGSSLGFDIYNIKTIDTPFQSIPLPSELPDSCIVVTTSVDSIFVSPFLDTPRIVNGKLEFKLADTVFCSGLNYVTINLQNTCAVCNNDHVALTFNWSCDPCEGVEMWTYAPLFLSIPLPGRPGYTNFIGFSSEKNVSNVSVTPLNRADYVEDIIITPDGDWTSVQIVFHCDPNEPPMSYFVPVEVCLTFEDNSICCDTQNIGYTCENFLWRWSVNPNPDLGLGTVNVFYELYKLPDFPLPLYIAIYDNNGNKKADVMNAVPTQLSQNIPVNVSTWTPGVYRAVFYMGNQIETFQFIKQ